jgi:mRNA-degrading endonuclease toxin of MazEF toxin-antitoxin module
MVSLSQGEANLPRAGHVNCSHLYTVDQTRLEGYVGTLSPNRMLEVDDALRYELDL